MSLELCSDSISRQWRHVLTCVWRHATHDRAPIALLIKTRDVDAFPLRWTRRSCSAHAHESAQTRQLRSASGSSYDASLGRTDAFGVVFRLFFLNGSCYFCCISVDWLRIPWTIFTFSPQKVPEQFLWTIYSRFNISCAGTKNTDKFCFYFYMVNVH